MNDALKKQLDEFVKAVEPYANRIQNLENKDKNILTVEIPSRDLDYVRVDLKSKN